ncbi:MAG: type II toxin-antitoxin system HicA family toxin [Acidobacteria bacterium]|nr:type II toxin-antitoxin system HicA family toxin [Acidobacteriota bacterium]MBI3657569.1 type II toxin-antitoxin system HicA family toxin [Acidobacteriota bacterium]
MSVLPRVSGREVIAALAKHDYEKDRQKGSHIVLRQVAYPHRRLVGPDHTEVAKGTLRTIIKQAGLTVEEFNKLLH